MHLYFDVCVGQNLKFHLLLCSATVAGCPAKLPGNGRHSLERSLFIFNFNSHAISGRFPGGGNVHVIIE